MHFDSVVTKNVLERTKLGQSRRNAMFQKLVLVIGRRHDSKISEVLRVFEAEISEVYEGICGRF